MIPVTSPLSQYTRFKKEFDEAAQRVLEKGWYILGEEVRRFEEEFATYIGGKFAIGVGSGTDALFLSLKALGIKEGDEVITVSHTAVATVAAIEMTGATPVFVDIDPVTFTMNATFLAQAVTKRTKAIVPVHIYGHPVDLDAVSDVARRQNIFLVEDCAQAHGARYKKKRVGSFGQFGCFSFYPTKNLGAFGDGGAIVTSDIELANKVRLLREYGWKERYKSQIAGVNSRLDELQAAFLRIKLINLDKSNESRVQLGEFYNRSLKGTSLVLPQTRADSNHVYHLYVVRSSRRDDLRAFLKNNQVETLIHYPWPVHQQPAYENRVNPLFPLTETENASQEVLSLPIFPELSMEDAGKVVDAIKSFEAGEK